jgi:biopolymer transport protein ExbD
MSIRHSRGSRHDETVELNITAFMNLMVILVPFLLVTAVFSQVAILELNYPSSQSEQSEVVEPEFQLEITIRASSIDIGDRASGLLRSIENASGRYDLEELSGYLQQIKQRFPDKIDATLLLEPDISYQALVSVMDAVRVLQQFDEESGQAAAYELFPEISIGDAPAQG